MIFSNLNSISRYWCSGLINYWFNSDERRMAGLLPHKLDREYNQLGIEHFVDPLAIYILCVLACTVSLSIDRLFYKSVQFNKSKTKNAIDDAKPEKLFTKRIIDGPLPAHIPLRVTQTNQQLRLSSNMYYTRQMSMNKR